MTAPGPAGPSTPYSGPPTPYSGPPTPYSGPPTPYSGPPTPYSGPPTPYSGPPTPYSGPPTPYSGPPMSYPDPTDGSVGPVSPPGLQDAPGVPTGPSVPGVPIGPSVPGVPIGPHVLGVPTGPHVLGVPIGPGVPGVPTGPGVQPPFAAPPTEGRTIRLWLGLGVAALAVLLCCGGGSVALVGFGIAATEAINEQAQVVVGDYFEAVRDGEYGSAYALLCDEARARESPAEFERRAAAEPEIDSYQVGELAIGGVDLVLPVEVNYTSGDQESLRVELGQDPQTAALRVCDIS